MRVLLAIVLLTGIAHAQPEGADTVTIRAKLNDTYALIASEYYGDRNKTAFIIAENKLGKAKPPYPGQKLKIPVQREITTSPGDSFATIADAYLGDPRRAQFLADANGLNPDDSLAAGTPLLVPFTVIHTAENKETLASIALAYYGDAKLGAALQAYNFLDKNTIEKAEAITIPGINVKVHPSKLAPPDAEAKARRERRKDNTRLAATAIPAARHAWHVGDYTTVKKLLSEIDMLYIEVGPAIEVGLLLGSALVAFGDNDGALEVFRRVLVRRPGLKLRKVDHSPKILAVWAKADGQVE